MNRDTDIIEVSDPRDLTIDDPPAPVHEIRVVKGEPTDDEIAALTTVLAAASGGVHEPGPQELNPWGHPVDKLRYSIFSWQRTTLQQRSHMRR
jgi:hypothetical protein